MAHLGRFQRGQSVWYAANWHDNTGTLADPTSPEAQIRVPAGTWATLTTPSKQNSKTGFYGGSYDVAADAALGEYVIRAAGTVGSKTSAVTFSFTVYLEPPPYSGGLRDMDFSDYGDLGTWAVERWERTSTELRLRLIEARSALTVEIPQTTWDSVSFPNAAENVWGEYKPVVYGTVRGAKGFVTDAASLKVRFAGHAVTSFLAVYVDGVQVTAASTDLSTAEVTLSAWTEGQVVTADLIGYSDVNPADCIEHILTTYGGEGSFLDATAFTAARARWVRGLDGATEEHTATVSLYLDRPETLSDILERVCRTACGLLYRGRAGTWKVIAFEPEAGESLPQLADGEIFDLSVEDDASDPATLVTVRYARDHTADAAQSTQATSTEYQTLRGLPAHATYELDGELDELGEAQLLASRLLRMRGVPLRVAKASVCQIAATWEPGDLVRLEWSDRGISSCWEVLELQHDPAGGVVDLLLGDLRGYRDEVGFWVGDTPTFPSRLGGGAATPWDSAWTDAQKTWARENVGYWEDDDSMVSDDADSFRASVWY